MNRESIMWGQQVQEHEDTSFAKKVVPAPMATFMRSSGSYIYIATAKVGASTSDDIWRIKRLDTTTLLDIKWADGNSNYDNIADNYDSLSYS